MDQSYCDICGLTVNPNVRPHPCRFERGCSCWRGIACHYKVETAPGSGNYVWLRTETATTGSERDAAGLWP